MMVKDEIEHLAEFPSENPFPVLRISQDGTILYSNGPGGVLLEKWNRKVGQNVPARWKQIIKEVLRTNSERVEDVKWGERIYMVTVVPISQGGYANIYGQDVTKEREGRKALQKARDELEMRVKERTKELTTEVAERKKAEKTAKAERQRFNDVLETLPVYVCLLTPDYYMPFANRVFRELFDYYPDKKCYEFLFNRKEPCEICQTYSVLKTNKSHEWEWTGPDGRNYYIFDLPFTAPGGSTLILEMGIDITERKRAERRQTVINSLLELFVKKTSRKEYLDSVVEVIRHWSGCRCVGIRLTNADGYIPYESCVGFSEEFLSLESMLCLNKDICACVRVVTQSPEPQDAAVVTAKGSFCCGDTFKFIESLADSEKKRFRGNCLKAGFASVAVVPIRYRQNILGAIHLADERENRVSLENVELLEDMAALIGEAVHRFTVEESLRSSESRLLEAQRLAHLGNWDWDIIRNRLSWSDEVYRIFGCLPQEFGATYEAFLSYVHPDDRKLVDESVSKALHEGKTYSIDHRVIRPDGSERIIHEKAEVTYDASRKPLRMIGTVHDVTEQKKAEEEIRRNQQQLRSLAAQLQQTEEQERRKIAGDLHDSVGQILAFSRRGIVALQKAAPEKTATTLREIAQQLDQAVKQTRTLSFDLSPSVLYDLGFEVAIEDLTERFSKDRKIQCRFVNSKEPKPLADAVKILLYRAVRELLINIAKHAKAKSAKVSLARDNNDIHVTVTDDGKGFDLSIFDSRPGMQKGFGLFSIRERLAHIGGRFEIHSARGKGTKVTLIAPLNIEKE